MYIYIYIYIYTLMLLVLSLDKWCHPKSAVLHPLPKSALFQSRDTHTIHICVCIYIYT